jgi:chitosanase
MPRQLDMPCNDVPEKTAQLQSLGFQVLGSAPTPGVSGFRTLRFQSAATATAPVAAMMLGAAPAPAAAPDPLQKRVAEAIVNIFETGEVLGKYGQVTVIEHDSGHLTFGRSQTTLSGNLWRLINDYCNAAGARFGARLLPYLPKLRDRLEALDHDQRLHNLLRATADDPVMRQVQDTFFDQAYWQPAMAEAAKMRIGSALGIAVVYDSMVHGAWEQIRDRTVHQYGPIGTTFSEQDWVKAYIKTRGDWLANNAQAVLHKTVYRMNCFQTLVDHDKWTLELPLLVRGKEISLDSLLAMPPDCYNGPAPGSRALAVTTPLARGADVRLLQLGLSDTGIHVTADGVYGNGSAAAVKQYQAAHGLAGAGVADKDLVTRIAESV